MKKITPYFLALSMVFAAGQSQAELTQQEIQDFEMPCQDVQSLEQAAQCVEPFYKASMDLAKDIWDKMHEGGEIDFDKLNTTQAGEYKLYEAFCVGKEDLNLEQLPIIKDYLRLAYGCLAISSTIADTQNTPYEKPRAAYLLHRADRLSRLDVK